MIKSLRKKFIAITMCSLVCVLSLIIIFINAANFHTVDQNLQKRIDIIIENGGTIPTPTDEDKNGDRKPDGKPDIGSEKVKKPGLNRIEDISPEAAFDTRYFTVTLNNDGTTKSIDTGKITAVSSDSAEEYARELFEKGRTDGYKSGYKFSSAETEDGMMYVFLDCEREKSSVFSFFAISAAVSTAGIILVFILVVLFSKIAVKPVAESYEKQRRFITDASHEIKTPLSVISANTDVIEMEQGETQWTKSTKQQIHKLKELTEGLIFLSRMDEDGSMPGKERFSLSDAVTKTANEFAAPIIASGKTLDITVEPNLAYTGNEKLIRQLVSILLDNALKYSPDSSEIKLTLKKSGRSNTLTVSNKCEGLSIGNQDILFERFYRPDTSRNSETGGSGIGLSAAKAIVTAHSGKISAQCDEQGIITFTVKL
ncbi:MAG: sensor histidine kinase [Acutalibacteraceae bacterium]